MSKGDNKVVQDRHPNFRGERGELFLLRCHNCEPKHGMANWAPAVASGQCAWCGWKDKKRKKRRKKCPSTSIRS
jgi:hypothetical protein